MVNKHITVIFDTNIWISFLITNSFPELDKLLKEKSIKVLFSEELLFEFKTVVQKPHLKKFISEDDSNNLLKHFNLYGKFVSVDSIVNVCRDSNDDFLLELAKDGDVDYIVTGDKDLLDIKQFGKCKIVTYRQFMKFIHP